VQVQKVESLELRSALTRLAEFASNGCGVWLGIDRGEHEFLVFDSFSKSLMRRVWITLAGAHESRRVTIADLCCGKDGLVYVLAYLPFKSLLPRQMCVFVYTMQGKCLRQWTVANGCHRYQLYILCGSRVYICD